MKAAICVIVLSMTLLVASCTEKAPPREEIPAIKAALTLVEAGVRERNRAAIDSVASVTMLEKNLSSDSLISLAWGNVEGRFARFSDCDIAYTNELAFCTCVLTDESGNRTDTIRITFRSDDRRWLLDAFKLTH